MHHTVPRKNSDLDRLIPHIRQGGCTGLQRWGWRSLVELLWLHAPPAHWLAYLCWWIHREVWTLVSWTLVTSHPLWAFLPSAMFRNPNSPSVWWRIILGFSSSSHPLPPNPQRHTPIRRTQKLNEVTVGRVAGISLDNTCLLVLIWVLLNHFGWIYL